MRMFKTTPQWNIMGWKKVAFTISAILLIVSIGGLIVKGLSYGIDFRGGTLIQIKFQETPQLEEIRLLFQDQIDKSANITTFGEIEENEVIVTLSLEAIQGKTTELSSLIAKILQTKYQAFDIRRVETVGPKVGSELKNKAVQAALFVLLGILIYIGFRFKVRYGIAAVIALFHDVLITLGFFVVLNKQFDLTVLAAILTIIGYSLNDTIIVFDRIRENVVRFTKKPMEEIINLSVNETLSRTIITSGTTFIVVFILFLMGGEIIRDFSFAMIIGLIVGTYSSIFVASPIVMYFDPAKVEQYPLYKWLIKLGDRFKKSPGKLKKKSA